MEQEIKTTSVRIPKDLWFFLRSQSIHQEISMNEIINNALNNYKINVDNKLTSDSTMVL